MQERTELLLQKKRPANLSAGLVKKFFRLLNNNFLCFPETLTYKFYEIRAACSKFDLRIVEKSTRKNLFSAHIQNSVINYFILIGTHDYHFISISRNREYLHQ